jgi:hypothetical protein
MRRPMRVAQENRNGLQQRNSGGLQLAQPAWQELRSRDKMVVTVVCEVSVASTLETSVSV